LVGVAVNVTHVPPHIVPVGVELTETEGVTIGFTVYVIVLDVAVVGLAQLALDVTMVRIAAPLASAVVV
jgi:hypothetical protein